MSRRTAELHADWLRLVEPEGQFLTLPILRRAFPNGLEAIQSSVRDQVRVRYPHSVDPSEQEWEAWVGWLLRDVLAWGPHYHTGDNAAGYTYVAPEHGAVLRADGVLCDPGTGNPRVLVMRYPHGAPLEKKIAGESWNTSPIDRIALLCRSHGVRIGIVTDGERIVLAWVPETGVGGYATWETALFVESRERGFLQSFASLLHASRFFAVQDDLQLEALFEASEKAQNEVTGQLGMQVRQAVELLVGALSRADLERDGTLLAGVAPRMVYEAAATVMMRLVFLLYAEERDLLPLSDPLYADYYAASTLREKLDEQAAMEGDEPLERRGAAWYQLLALFRVLFAGLQHDRLRVPPYGGRLFDPDRFPFLEGRSAGESWTASGSRPLPIDDLTVRAILEAIQTLPITESGSKERRRLSFRSLDVEQIGHVYEGLLDHGAVRVDDVYVGLVGRTGDEAEIPLADLEKVANEGVQPLVSFLIDSTHKSESVVRKMIQRGGAVFDGSDAEARRLVNTVCDNNAALAGRVSPFVYALRTDLHGLPVVFPSQSLVVKQTRARRDSGTEYTPRELAEEMVRYALEPLVYTPGPREGADPKDWRLRPSEELLDLKVCDPAVGSGAFLVSACRYLADRVVEAWITEDPLRADASREELTLDARRAVADRCLYGVDRDAMAVEMAKLSLWLVTMARERPFSFLDHAIRVGDSLLGITSLDQLKYLHIDPERGRALNARMHFDVTERLSPLVDRAAKLRLELEQLPNITVRDAEHKQALNEQANRLLEDVDVIADAIIATALFVATQSEAKQDAAFQGLASLVRATLDTSLSTESRREALAKLHTRNQQMLSAGRPQNGPPRITLHWRIAFPEVFDSARMRRGFDAIIGNPPFVGGKKITGTVGQDYRSYLVRYIGEGRRGSADLVAYFFLRAASLARNVGFLAVNTIAEGDSREVCLDALASGGWSIVRAVRSRPWPGVAGVHIAQVWLSMDPGLQRAFLDNQGAKSISPRLLESGRVQGNPFRLTANAATAFIGSVVLGMGFAMSPSEAAALIAKDSRYADVLFPLLNADDLCSNPHGSPSRWVINFFDWTLERASQYSECIAIVRERVKPQRDTNKKANYREQWWRYAERCPGLYRAASSLDRVIAMPLHSKVVLPMFYPTGIVFSHAVAVIVREDFLMFGVLTSTLHREWARKWGSSLETRTRYTPSECFETFPFPSAHDGVAALAHELDTLRSSLMKETGSGLTAIYNRLHNQSDMGEGIVKLRSLHAALDLAVMGAYGWNDVELDYGFYKTEEGLRWTIGEVALSEILDRLLELNLKRHGEDVERELGGALSTNRAETKSRAKRSAAPDLQISLMDVR